MQLLSRFRKRSITYKVVAVLLFSLFLINNIIYLIQPFAADTIFEYYTTGYFSIITSFQHLAFGFLPISVGDIFYISTVIIILVEILILIFSILFRKTQKLLNVATNTTLLILLIWFLIGSQWNWNYSQPSIEEKFNLDTTEYSIDELASFTADLIEKTIKYKEVSDFEILSKGTNSIIDISHLGYSVLAKENDFFHYPNPSIKYSLFSDVLPYFGISGYYNPFTAEAQITKGIPTVQIPFVINHEIAHQLGIASEAEANFIGYLASINNPLSTVKYSGNMSLLLYCLSDLRMREYKDYNKLIKTIPANIKTDIKDISDFWGGYRNKYRKHFDKGYDKFLKSNNQKDGMKSYNKIVSLAIFYNRKH